MSFKCYSLAIKQTTEKQSSLKVCFGKIKRQQTLNFSLALSQLVTQSVSQATKSIHFFANNSIWFWKSLLKVCHHSMVLKMFPIFYLVFQLQKKKRNERTNESQHQQSKVKKKLPAKQMIGAYTTHKTNERTNTNERQNKHLKHRRLKICCQLVAIPQNINIEMYFLIFFILFFFLFRFASLLLFAVPGPFSAVLHSQHQK